MKDDGGPAFPRTCVTDTGDTVWAQDGMSLRDWFAGQALQGYVASATDPLRLTVAEQLMPIEDLTAHWTYLYADAMLQERNKTK